MGNFNIKDYLVNTFTSYVEAKAEPYIEKGIAKISHIIGIVLSALFLLFALLMVAIYLGIGFALIFSQLTGNYYWGFLIVALIYLMAGWVVWVLRRSFGRWIEKIALREKKHL
ncbi:MAG TPA: hypothetical protein VK766_09115 [Cytophagaceae bacterium]|jgi:hypothetical protein|nr:hypothetical protein [Cytophagaceae bacterium]